MSGQPLRAAGYSPDSILDCQVFKNLEALKREIGLEDNEATDIKLGTIVRAAHHAGHVKEKVTPAEISDVRNSKYYKEAEVNDKNKNDAYEVFKVWFDSVYGEISRA